jgi:Tfp pilus assembly protein PilF
MTLSGAAARAASLLSILSLMIGCVRHATVSQDFGLGMSKNRPRALQRGESVRAILRHQTQGAFNPIIDDPRVQELQSRIKLDPKDAGARLQLAAVYEIYRLCDDGLSLYREALQILHSQPRTGDGSALLTEEAILGVGRCGRSSGRTAEALSLIEPHIKDYASASAWHELGLLREASGDLQAAEYALREAAALELGSDAIHNSLGYNLLLQSKSEAAEGKFRKALDLNPKSVIARNNLGTVLARRGDLEGALEQFRLAADAAAAHNNLAVVLLEIGEYEQSREQLIKALAIRRNFAPALSNFKLVQERIRQRGETRKIAPPDTPLEPPARLALGEVVAPASGDPQANPQARSEAGAQPRDPEDRR